MTAANRRSGGRVSTRSLVAYILLAHALAWLICLPLWGAFPKSGATA